MATSVSKGARRVSLGLLHRANAPVVLSDNFTKNKKLLSLLNAISTQKKYQAFIENSIQSNKLARKLIRILPNVHAIEALLHISAVAIDILSLGENDENNCNAGENLFWEPSKKMFPEFFDSVVKLTLDEQFAETVQSEPSSIILSQTKGRRIWLKALAKKIELTPKLELELIKEILNQIMIKFEQPSDLKIIHESKLAQKVLTVLDQKIKSNNEINENLRTVFNGYFKALGYKA